MKIITKENTFLLTIPSLTMLNFSSIYATATHLQLKTTQKKNAALITAEIVWKQQSTLLKNKRYVITVMSMMQA